MVLKETILSINVTKCKEETMAYGAQKEFAATNKVMMWWSALISVVLLCLPLAAGAGVPNPTVTGPIPANVKPGDASHDYPQLATSLDLARPIDLASLGYVEEEYFFSGTANVYSAFRPLNARVAADFAVAWLRQIDRRRRNALCPSPYCDPRR